MGIFDKVRDRLMGDVTGTPVEVKTVEDQPQGERELAGFVRKKVEESRANANRVAHEGIWMTNIAYLMGFDSIYYDTQTRQYQPLARASGFIAKNRVHENVLLPMAQNRLARLCKVPPRFDTLPNSPSEEDKEAALLSLDILVDLWHRQEINRKRIPMGMWLQQCGHAYLKVSFDSTIGNVMTDPETGEFQGREGEVRVDVVSAFEVFPDPLAKELTEDECAWVVHAKIRSIDYFKSHYERGELVKPESPWLLSLQYEARVNSVNVFGPGSSGDLGAAGQNTAVELSYYERASIKHPNGRHVITANGVLLKDDELPVGMYPFAKFDDIVVGGKYYSECCTTHARPLQDQYNKTLTRRAEWVNKMLAGKYIAARMHGLMKEALNDRNGEVVEYDVVPNAKEPHAMEIPTIPQYAYEETTQLKNGIASIYGLSEIARGIVQPSMPAIGMQLILEQDETRIGIETEQHEHAFARVGTLALKYCEKFYKTRRSLRKRDDQGNYSVKYYTGEDLKGNTACMVIRGSTVPTSKSLRRQEIMNTYQQGLMGNPMDPAVRMRVMQLMEYGDNTGMWKQYSSDMQQIKKCIKDIETGVVTLVEQAPMVPGQPPQKELTPPVSEFDNHVLFIQELNEYRKSEKYDELDVDKKEVLLAVMNAHLEWQTRIMNPQVAMPPKAPMNLDGVVNQAEQAAQAGAEPLQDSGQGLDKNSQPSEDMAVARG
jgi:hypothetical protein